MAKIRHNDSYSTYESIINDAKQRGLIQLQDTSQGFNGKNYQINDKALLNFGYCGYLGLEMHSALKNGAIECLSNNGMQYGVSRAYITSQPEKELLGLLSEIYDHQPVIVQSSTSSSHIANIPNLIEGSDAIILDQQVHFSVQTGAQLCRQNGVPIEMIRHNNLEMLRRKYHELKDKCRRIWYMVDGVYSMYGDTCPIQELKELLAELPQLHLYVDDAHGMSWRGKKGCGYFYSQMGKNEKVILNVTMGKGFGVTGGVTIYPTAEFYNRVKTFGGPLTYSHPLSPAITGAAIASAKLHLSDEFVEMQNELQQKIDHCEKLLANTNLPVLSNAETPIFFIGLGQPKTAYNMVEKLFNEGFYVNAALFPAVSVKCSGIRFSISQHNSLEDITALVAALEKLFPIVVAEENTTNNKIRQAFKLPLLKENIKVKTNSNISVEHYRDINDIDEAVWNGMFKNEALMSHQGLKFLKNVFENNPEIQSNWKWHILLARQNKQIVGATFLTEAIVKDDIFMKASISEQLEKHRITDPNFLISKTLMMGSLLTEGDHLYISPTANEEQVMDAFLSKIDEIQDECGATNVILRDFDEFGVDNSYFFKNGYIKNQLPNANYLEFEPFSDINEFAKSLNYKKRRHLATDVKRHYHKFQVYTDEVMNAKQIRHCHNLFLNVKRNNLSVNIYDYPISLINNINISKHWDVINLYIAEKQLPVGTIWSYKGEGHYWPMLLGFDYAYLNTHRIYKQCLYRTIERANQLGYTKMHFGFSADLEKRKLGCIQQPKVAFIRNNDMFAIDYMQSMSVETVKV
ncbi:MAG: aminotransferase class I/II-fold pyridoxal phosphate-dependent enzyme [Bacteroidetes bacterium]|nr:aminotransferase class I/II-fold pyridoxal phosphate-dependent enzyme [Bacteroidota bacterium]